MIGLAWVSSRHPHIDVGHNFATMKTTVQHSTNVIFYTGSIQIMPILQLDSIAYLPKTRIDPIPKSTRDKAKVAFECFLWDLWN